MMGSLSIEMVVKAQPQPKRVKCVYRIAIRALLREDRGHALQPELNGRKDTIGSPVPS